MERWPELLDEIPLERGVDVSVVGEAEKVLGGVTAVTVLDVAIDGAVVVGATVAVAVSWAAGVPAGSNLNDGFL